MMSILYPDNRNRANRVSQLCGDIARLQTQVKEAVEDAKCQDTESVSVLEKIAKQKGYKALDEFVAEAQKRWSEEDRTKYEQMKKEFDKKDENIEIAIKVSSGLIAVGRVVGVGCLGISLLPHCAWVTVALKAFGIGLLRVITGRIQDGVALFKATGNVLRFGLKGGPAMSGKVATVSEVLKKASSALIVFGAAFDLVLLIYQAVEGSKQQQELQTAIKELCLYRLTMKMVQQYSRVALQLASDAKGILRTMSVFQELVDRGAMDQDVADISIATQMMELERKLVKDIDSVNTKAVYEMLKQQDNKSNIAWTDNDPSFNELKRLVNKQLAKSEKQVA